LRCKNSDPRVLEFDHIRGDGFLDRVDRKGWRSGDAQFWKYFREGTARQHYQMLCANCHRIKTREEGEQNGLKGETRYNAPEEDDPQGFLF
jgi:hypothetical protein